MSEVIISVRGDHEERIAAEEGVVSLSVRVEGPERGPVVERIAALTAPLRSDLDERKTAGDVAEWSSQRAAVWADRPWNSEGRQLPLVHHASVEISATFVDFAALSWWLTQLAETEGVEIGAVEWRLSRATAVIAEADVAARAVRVAVERATAYADALGLGTVTPLEIADAGLLPRPEHNRPEMVRMSAATFAADAGGPGIDLQPAPVVVSASVEGRFAAR